MGFQKEALRRFYDEIFSRDNYRCVYCGSTTDLVVDHVVPVSAGGSSDLRNLVTACRGCNNRKGARQIPFQRRLKLAPVPGRVERKRLVFYVDAEQLQELKENAQSMDLRLGQLVRHVLTDWLIDRRLATSRAKAGPARS